ncbi:MAG: TIGR03085 family metal-binding protein [Acidimicrobiales bacterium]
MPSIAQSERQALCDLLEAKGPLAPTLCEGWTTSDLAAHLYVREAKPLAAPGIMLPQFADLTQRAMDRAKGDLGYGSLIAKIRSGPPYPMRLLDASVNAIEYFVHLEDVRRVDGDVEPRVDSSIDRLLWSRVKLGARVMSRRFKAGGLRLDAPRHGTVTARAGEPGLVVTGGPQELMLLLFGRQGAARIELDGAEALRGALYATSFGL